jgi:hypothetical protein
MSLTLGQQQHIRLVASNEGYAYPVLAAIIDKESNGRFYWKVNGRDELALNIEGHYFYRNLAKLAPEKLKETVAAGLAAKKARVVEVPNSYAGRYAMFGRMKAIHREAAYRSVSSGVGQIMGEGAGAMGFKSAEALFEYGKASWQNQIDLIVRFIKTKPKLVAGVLEEDCDQIGYYYNGPAYKTNNYANDLRDLIDKYDTDGVVYVEPVAASARDVARIKALGWHSVEAFQSARGLNADGVIGNLTRDELAKAEAERKPKVPTVAKVAGGAAVTVAGGAVVAAEDPTAAGDLLTAAEPVIGIVQNFAQYGWKVAAAVAVVVIIGGIAYAIWKRSKRTT